MTEKAFLNALTVDMALGCSTNSMLHLPAIAHEAGVELNMELVNEMSVKTPNLCHLAPAGPTYMEDLNEAGGVYAVMNELAKKDLLNLDCLTVTGKTVGENIANCINRDPEVIRPIDNPYSETGGIAVLKGNLAPDTAVVKRSAVAPEMLKHEGPARVFDYMRQIHGIPVCLSVITSVIGCFQTTAQLDNHTVRSAFQKSPNNPIHISRPGSRGQKGILALHILFNQV